MKLFVQNKSQVKIDILNTLIKVNKIEILERALEREKTARKAAEATLK